MKELTKKLKDWCYLWITGVPVSELRRLVENDIARRVREKKEYEMRHLTTQDMINLLEETKK